MNHISEFFAVTETSLYRITIENNCSVPVMTKMALRSGATSKRPVGRRVEGWDKPTLCIRGSTVQLCNGWEEDHHHADYTSALIALFLDEAQAHECADTSEVQELSPRWREQTLEVLRRIGEDHPCITVFWEAFPPEYIRPPTASH